VKRGAIDARAVADPLHGAAIRLLRYARAADAATGLTAPRLSVLSLLVFGGPGTVSALAEAEQVAVPTMTRLLQALEADGYVRRRRDRSDARRVEVTATARGRRVLEAGRRARLDRIEQVLADASPAELALLGGAAELRLRLLRRT
jgi:DNA-binding MarR family transcriptional regulator